ncbi:MAG TPA: tetratricopeptide repeat protein [Candidatus Acidoferrales bacterium]|nr:tetratricopeptide repeat protein [Candidatus Acidoferrales bacterium]
MNRIAGITAGLCLGGIVAGALPAHAQTYSNEFSLAKVEKQGMSSHDIAGSGEVTVQVQVNADGSHKVIKVIKSTNPGDNAAALDIAQSSSYSPAHRGTRAVVSFYDFTLKFNGKAIVNAQQGAEAGSGGVTAAIDALVRAGKYKDAIAKADDALAASPNDPDVLQLLGVAQYYDNDLVNAATNFSKVQVIKAAYRPVAAQAFASAATQAAATDPQQALDFAQRAMAISSSANAKYAYGVAQVANKQYTDALTTLRSVHDQVSDPKARINIDQEILVAELGNNDTADADATAAEMKALDPANGGEAAAHVMAQHYLEVGTEAFNAKDYTGALKSFEAAIATGSTDPRDVVTANSRAALAVLNGPNPNYVEAKDYALKAVAAAPDDPVANYYAGAAYANIYSTSNRKDDRTQALTYLNKADQLARAAGNGGLAAQIEAQIRNLSQ